MQDNLPLPKTLRIKSRNLFYLLTTKLTTMKVYKSKSDLSLMTLVGLSVLKIRYPNLEIIEVSDDDLISYVDNPNSIVIAAKGDYDNNFSNYLGYDRVNNITKDFKLDIQTSYNIISIVDNYTILFSRIATLSIEDRITIISLFIKTL